MNEEEGEENSRGRAFLSLMQLLYYGADGALSPAQLNLQECISVISDDLQFTGVECKDYVVNILMCMRQVGLPNDAAMEIAKYGLMDRLKLALREFSFRDTNDY